MLIGMDVGGTNTDVAMVDDGITSLKVPNTLGIRHVLGSIRRTGRLAVSTSTPLNRVLTGPRVKVQTILIPGPGLFWPGSIRGAVNHRGDIVEGIDREEVDVALADRGDVLAIAGKFSVRNPSLEQEVAARALHHYPEEKISLSHPLCALNFPARVATTRLNARIREAVTRLTEEIGGEYRDFLFFKGDGGLIPPDYAVSNPSVLYRSSATAVALGAYYLSGEAECLVVDFGGTTTDLVALSGGRPVMETLVYDGGRTVTTAVAAESLPYGGDSLIEGGLCPTRVGNALAFGGNRPTLTDALNATGCEIGDAASSRGITRLTGLEVLEEYYSHVSQAVEAHGARRLVGTGYLAPFLLPEIARRTGAFMTIPPHWDCANAVGVAISRVSLTLYARFDSGRGLVVFNGEPEVLRKMGDDEAVLDRCREEVQQRALAAGADPCDVEDVQVLFFHTYDVIRSAYRSARIADVVVQIAPGITAEAP
jgi:hypothetical protein